MSPSCKARVMAGGEAGGGRSYYFILLYNFNERNKGLHIFRREKE